MKCRSVLTRIDAMRTGELPAAETHEVEDHVTSCGSCNESVADVVTFASAIRSLAPNQPRASVSAALHDRFDSFDVDGRRVWVAWSPRGIRMIDVRAGSPDEFRAAYQARFGRELTGSELGQRERQSITATLRGQPAELPQVDITTLTDFEQEVLRAITAIPRGEVRTYEWVARAAKRPKAIRAVGNVMATNPLPFVLPCHRVVPTSGGIGNYGFGPEMKRDLLAAEGTPVEEIEALGRSRVRYIGSRTTKIFCFPTCRDARRIQEANRVPFHDAGEACQRGFRPCKRCAPVVAA
jgi:O-6-methylguanine DNA methyltransferase